SFPPLLSGFGIFYKLFVVTKGLPSYVLFISLILPSLHSVVKLRTVYFFPIVSFFARDFIFCFLLFFPFCFAQQCFTIAGRLSLMLITAAPEEFFIGGF